MKETKNVYYRKDIYEKSNRMYRKDEYKRQVDTESSIVEVLAEYRMFKKLRRRWLTSKLELLKEVRESL